MVVVIHPTSTTRCSVVVKSDNRGGRKTLKKRKQVGVFFLFAFFECLAAHILIGGAIGACDHGLAFSPEPTLGEVRPLDRAGREPAGE